jgi:hypothetical protein
MRRFAVIIVIMNCSMFFIIKLIALFFVKRILKKSIVNKKLIIKNIWKFVVGLGIYHKTVSLVNIWNCSSGLSNLIFNCVFYFNFTKILHILLFIIL